MSDGVVFCFRVERYHVYSVVVFCVREEWYFVSEKSGIFCECRMFFLCVWKWYLRKCGMVFCVGAKWYYLLLCGMVFCVRAKWYYLLVWNSIL